MVENLNTMIEAFFEWYKNDTFHKEDAYPELKSIEFLKGLNRDEFIDYFFRFVHDGGKIQSGGARNAGKFREMLEINYEKFRKFVLSPYQPDFNIDLWLKKVDDFNFFGRGSATIFLNRLDKNRFAIVNNKSQNALKELGYKVKGDFISIYHSIENAQKDLIKKFPEIKNFNIADVLNHFLIGTEEGKKFLATEIKSETHEESNFTVEEIQFVNKIRSAGDLKSIQYHFDMIDKLIEILKLKIDDRKVVFATPQAYRSIAVIINQRYIFHTVNDYFGIIVSGALKDYIEKNERVLKIGNFNSLTGEKDPPVWVHFVKGTQLSTEIYEEWQKAILKEYNYGTISSFVKHDNSAYRKAAFDKEYREKIINLAFSGDGIKVGDVVNDFKPKKPKFIDIPQNLILYGPPGTGKTYKLISKYVDLFTEKADGKSKEIRYEMITFHQSYSYEEFMEGIRPGFDEEEELRYKIEPGIFLRIAEKARKDSKNNYAIFIDEINRGNISKIFGELITLIEPDKRQGGENELEVILPYSKSKFSVPSNLYIIGTMNTADRSIALIDTALRRRFCFKEMMPDSSLLSDDIQGINLQILLSKINERIEFLLDRDHTIGHSFLMKANSKNEICTIFKNKIIPLLQEYFYNDWEKVQLVLGDNKSWGKTEEQKLVRVKKHYDLSAEKELFGYDIEDFEDEIIYEINPALDGESFEEIPAESFINIYQKPGKAIF